MAAKLTTMQWRCQLAEYSKQLINLQPTRKPLLPIWTCAKVQLQALEESPINGADGSKSLAGTRPALNHSTIAGISCVRALWSSALSNKDSRIVFKIPSANTAQSCSNYQQLLDSRTRGIAGIGIKEWIGNRCGVTHGRDVHAAKKIPALGHERPTVEIPFQRNDLVGEDVKPPFAISLGNYWFKMGMGRMRQRRNCISGVVVLRGRFPLTIFRVGHRS